MDATNDSVKRPGWWLLLITLLGLALRLAAFWQGESFSYFAFGDEILAYDRALDYAMGVDEARYLSQAKFTVDSHTPGALWSVFWLNAMRLGGGPHAVSAVMLMLNVGVILLVYLLGSRLLGTRGGLWAALFMATQPWAVYYAVGAYNPEIMPFFGSLVLLALWQAISHDRSLNFFWVGLLPIIALQFHASAFAMLCGALAVAGLTRRRLHWPAFILGLLAGLLFYLPYILGDGAHDWQNTKNMFGGEGDYSFGCLKAITTPFSLLMSWCPRWTLPAFQDYMAMGNAVCGSFVVMFAFKALGTAAMLVCLWRFIAAASAPWRGTRGNPRAAFAHAPGLVFIGMLLIAPLLIFLLSRQNYSSRYALFQLPVLVLIPAWAMVHGFSNFAYGKLARRTIVITILFNVYFLFAFFNYQGQLIASHAKFLPSFRCLAAVYDTIKSDAGPTRAIEVHDVAFLAAYPKSNAEAIGMYVSAREKEARMQGLTDNAQAVVVYELVPESSPSAAIPAVWRSAGIMVVRRAKTGSE